MRVPRSNRRWMMGLALGVTLGATGLNGQEPPLTRAKAYYASAAYEDALRVLASVGDATPPLEATEVAAYRMFCLVALGRTDEARVAVESLVRLDPLYRPAESQVSPRVRDFFDEVRRPMLPDAVKQTYAKAREAHEKRDLRAAAEDFGHVLALFGEIENAEEHGIDDLRTLAAGFKDLIDMELARAEAEAAAAAAEAERAAKEAEAARAAAEAAAEAEAAVAEPEPDPIYTEEEPGIVRPEPISRTLPHWVPPTAIDARQQFSGILELIIDEAGKVETALMRMSVHPLYDSQLLRSAKSWRFEPAKKDGTPVKYRYRLGIDVGK